MREPVAVERQDKVIKLPEQLEPLRRNVGRHETTVVANASAVDESLLLHAIEQPGDIRDGPNQPLAHLVTAESAFARPAQDSKHVVLRGGDAVRLQHLRHLVIEYGGRPGDIQRDLFLQTGPRACLLEFVSEVSRHT